MADAGGVSNAASADGSVLGVPASAGLPPTRPSSVLHRGIHPDTAEQRCLPPGVDPYPPSPPLLVTLVDVCALPFDCY